jgi:hypothetical protein
MALAAFASIFMGNSLEGGLLLAMFDLAHIGIFDRLRNSPLFQLLFVYLLLVFSSIVISYSRRVLHKQVNV